MTKLSPTQQIALTRIKEYGGKVRVFSPTWGSKGFATVGEYGPRIHYRTATALIKKGVLRITGRFAQDATESKARASGLYCVLVRSGDAALGAEEEAK